MKIKNPRILIVTSDSYMFRFFTVLLKETDFFVLKKNEEAGICAEVGRVNPGIILIDIDDEPGPRLLDICRIVVDMPRPILMVTRDHEKSRHIIVKGFDLGAVDVITIPDHSVITSPGSKKRLLKIVETGVSTNILPSSRDDALRLLKSVSSSSGENDDKVSQKIRAELSLDRQYDIVGIAISTGGPNALGKLIPLLPADFPVPILIVQHIIPGFIDGIVKKLNDSCDIDVKLAEDGESIRNGMVYFAPDNMHLKVEYSNSNLRVKLDSEPSDVLFRPCADVLFESMASCCGERCLGVIMTGMGHDGVEGLKIIKKKGGYTIAQDRMSSTIYGMARVAVDANLIDRVVPLNRIAGELYNTLIENNFYCSEKTSSSS
ncbi:MAG TPA: chemotaxis protein CheB [bacterium]|nr:chemotaxis protein CheB [bacterium]